MLVSIAKYIKQAVVDDDDFTGMVSGCDPLKQQAPSQVKAVEIKNILKYRLNAIVLLVQIAQKITLTHNNPALD